MALIVVILNRPKAVVRGILRNAMLEPQSNIFVGNLDSRRIKNLADLLERTQSDALLCAAAPKEDHGLRIKMFGKMPNRRVIEIDQIQLISKITSESIN